MLYLSRVIDDRSYGVVDTDDDVEQVVTREELSTAIIKYGIAIEGIAYDKAIGGYRLRFDGVYQDPRYCSTLQMKAKTVLGVDIVTFRDEIVSILVDKSVVRSGLRVRLSDYATKFNCFSPIGWSVSVGNGSLVLVFDDSIEFVGGVPRFETPDVCLDLSDVTNEALVTKIYEKLAKTNSIDYTEWPKFVMDRPERYRFWRYVGMMESAPSETDEFVLALKNAEDRGDIGRRVGEIYKPEFESMANIDISKTFFTSLSLFDFVGFVRNFLPNDVSPYVTCTDYYELRSSFIGMFQMLKVVSTVNSYSLLRFENYIKFFDVSDDIKLLYVQMCNNVAKGLIQYCKEHKD